MKPRVLVVDDDPAMCEVLREGLSDHGYDVTTATDPAEALAQIRSRDWEAVVTDLNMPGQTGISLCQACSSIRPELPVILITAFGTLATAIAAIRAGAWDFVTKPLDPDALALSLGRACEVRGLRRDLRILRADVREGGRMGEMLGQSPAMKEVFTLLERVCAQDITVLVGGETGTGKELVARAIHQLSPRSSKPFVAFSGAALPENLVEGELFGHVRGAFTDAKNPRRGVLFEADGGTLFLDEVGELPLPIQAKLLRALQERRVRPLGAEVELPFDVRVVAASNRNLSAEVEAGRFRADLYYRLQVVEVVVPPLRSRGNDILLLAQHFVEKAALRMGKGVRGISPEAAARLMSWRWPGNVRELSNVMERAVALCPGTEVQVSELPEGMQRRAGGAEPVGEEEELLSLEEVEKRHILRVLAAVGGSKASAARVLGLDRATLYRRLERYGER